MYIGGVALFADDPLITCWREIHFLFMFAGFAVPPCCLAAERSQLR